MSSSTTSEWLTVMGKKSLDIEEKLSAAVAEKIRSNKYQSRDIEYIASLSRPLIDGTLITSQERLEKLRALCQLWDVEITPVKITSHRPIIGPVIVAFKKTLQPIIRILLKDFIRQQKDFNAATISLLADLSNDAEMTNTSLEKNSH